MIEFLAHLILLHLVTAKNDELLRPVTLKNDFREFLMVAGRMKGEVRKNYIKNNLNPVLEKMRNQVNENLQYFVDYCHQYGIAAEAYAAFGTDTVEELTKIAEQVNKKYSNCIFFSSKLIFEKDSWITRLLHNETPLTLQRYLHLQGKELVILPMKI